MPADNTEEINEIILSCLIENARMSSQEIHKRLKSHRIDRTPRAILERINKLEKEGRIAGYTLKTQPQNFEGFVIRMILISFKTSPAFNERVAMFTSYLRNAPFAAFAGRTRGEYDWINIKIFPNTKIANQESDMYRTVFGDIIDKYTAFDVTVVKAPRFIQATNYSIEDFYEFYQGRTTSLSFKEVI
ncbi:MAG: histidine kinase [Thermoproteota archaeon]|nr:histidine kinase [Thermoproteota archaeon]